MSRALLVLAMVLALAALPLVAMAEGWRPAIPPRATDAEWLKRLDARLVPVHGSLIDTFELWTGVGPGAEEDAYTTLIQEAARRGIVVLDEVEPAPACARDYVALERTMMLLWGDFADAWRQFRAGSAQARQDALAMGPAALYMLQTYGDTIRATTVCETPEPARSPTPLRTPTPVASATP